LVLPAKIRIARNMKITGMMKSPAVAAMATSLDDNEGSAREPECDNRDGSGTVSARARIRKSKASKPEFLVPIKTFPKKRENTVDLSSYYFRIDSII